MESVWDYPRPPRLERTEHRLEVVYGGQTIASTNQGWRVLETSHPPVYYIPPGDVNMDFVARIGAGGSWCEWKGQAAYFDVIVPGHPRLQRVAWAYPNPTERFAPIADHLAFYADPMDGCFVSGERVTPQPGRFYGGWITKDIQGPFKGGPGTMGW